MSEKMSKIGKNEKILTKIKQNTSQNESINSEINDYLYK